MSEYRLAEGKIKFLQSNDPFNFPVELWLYNDADNRNGWRFVNLEQHRAMWAGKPILIAYTNNGRQIGDGHNFAQSTDRETGEPVASFTGATAERIVGATSDDGLDIRLVSEDEKTWVVAKGALWAWYARELVAKIVNDAEQGREMSISIEALVDEFYMDGDIEVETRYLPLGATILGDHVMPAVENAHIAMLSADEDAFKQLKMRAASYAEDGKTPNETNTKTDKKKGMTQTMRMSNQQLRELQAKFGDSHTVLAGEKTDAGYVICLADKGGKTAVYVMKSLDDTIVPEGICEINAQVHFCAEGCDDVLVDACNMVEAIAADRANLSARLNSAETELNECKNTINTMREVENKRRVSAAKEKATATLSAFNANRESTIDEKVLSAVTADIESGLYTCMVDADGNWTGDKAVEKEVLSLCASAVMEMDKKAADAKKTSFVWERMASGEADDGSIKALLARKNIL